MKIAVFVLLAIVSWGCKSDPMQRTATGKDGRVTVDLIFVHDGVKMYRFYDGDGRAHYYAVPLRSGETAETITTWQECRPCGKSTCCTSQEDNIRTAVASR